MNAHVTPPLIWDTDAAVQFLKQWPTPFPTLSASWLDAEQKKARFETRSFPAPVDWNAVAKWIEERQGKANIYFSVNSIKAVRKNARGQELKTERTDIREVVALHVDVDARVDETQAEARERIVTGFLKHKPEPSVVVFSGGGAQGFWFLSEPIVIDGDLEKAEDAKRYNITLERDFGGDACHNVDRIMRVPYTVNLPDTKKIKKGRRAVVAEVVEFTTVKHPLSSFTKAPADVPGGNAPTATSNVPANIERLQSLDDPRLANVPGSIKVLVMTGADPDEPGKYPSRSEALFGAVCGLVRAEVPDEVIYALIIDPDYKISASVVERRKDMRRYALRQIKNARSAVALDVGSTDDKIAELNEKHFIIASLGGKCRIGSYEKQGRERDRLVFSTADDFNLRYANKYVLIEGKPTKLGPYWLGHRERKTFEGVTFDPSGGPVLEGNLLNLWKGYGCEAREGDCSPFLDHLRNVVCDGDADSFTYLMQLLAWKVQHPAEPTEICLALRGEKGTGKGFLAREFGRLFGRHFFHITNPRHLVGNFNAHLRDCCVLFADEAFIVGNKQHESILKTLATEPTIPIEGKGIDLIEADNHLFIILSTNDDWVVPMSHDERRYFVLRTSSKRRGDRAYFKRLYAHMESGGREALLHHLLNFDLGDFHPRDVPETSEGKNQKTLSRHGIDAFVEEVCHSGQLPFAFRYADVASTSGRQGGMGLHAYLDANYRELKGLDPQILNRPLKDVWGCTRWQSGAHIGLRFPSLATLRAKFVERHGLPPGGWEHSKVTEWAPVPESKESRDAPF